MKKAFAFFLALLLILPLLPSCGEKEPAETTAATDGTTDGSVDIPTTPAVTEELPAVVETSFDGYTFVILACAEHPKRIADHLRQRRAADGAGDEQRQIVHKHDRGRLAAKASARETK